MGSGKITVNSIFWVLTGICMHVYVYTQAQATGIYIIYKCEYYIYINYTIIYILHVCIFIYI